MTISTRTPEGWPAKCPICGHVVRVDPSQPAGDAACPRWGSLADHLTSQRTQGDHLLMSTLFGNANIINYKVCVTELPRVLIRLHHRLLPFWQSIAPAG